MNRTPMIMILTGVDGTLIDRTPQSSEVAADAIDLLAREGIPVVLCSENTRADLEFVRGIVSNRDPFISENEAAIHIPRGYFSYTADGDQGVRTYSVTPCACPHAHVALTLHLLARQIDVEIVAFSDLTPEEIAQMCRISPDRARLAKRREYDEPFRVVSQDNTVRARLVRALHAARLRCIAGDSYCHVNGVVDREATIERLRTMYEEAFGCPVLAVGLGSRLCDIALLKSVDLPIIVRDEWLPATETLLRKVPIARVTSSSGSAGWSHAVRDVLRTVHHMRASATPFRPA